jgi:hypothetical protein
MENVHTFSSFNDAPHNRTVQPRFVGVPSKNISVLFLLLCVLKFST